MDIKSLLPESVLWKAYEVNSEYAWRPEDLSMVADALRVKRLAVLGGEMWQKSDQGPVIGPEIYQWTAEPKSKDENWDGYVERTLTEMAGFAKKLSSEIGLQERWPNIYINFEVIAEP
jgi:hypothetical protein